MSELRLALLHGIIRREEKLLIEAFRRFPEVELSVIDDREISFSSEGRYDFDAVLCRSVSFSRGLYARRLFEARGLRCFNGARVAEICGDKLLTSLALEKDSVPQPEFRVAFDETAALRAMEAMGFPVVMKPVVGSWGRLVARACDRDSAESLLEHRAALPNYLHHVYYLQRYVDKGGYDIRAFVVGDRVVAAIRRWSENWRTNTHRGGRAEAMSVDTELEKICLQAARAVEGGMLAIDLFETEAGYLVNEVNDTMEFRNSIEPTGVDIPAEIAGHVVSELAREAACGLVAS
ncbi:MAG: lysine biosynthesis protein LysX [Vicinamibacteria bacterium]